MAFRRRFRKRFKHRGGFRKRVRSKRLRGYGSSRGGIRL